MTDVVLLVLPKSSSTWKCGTCASCNEATVKKCELCKAPAPDVTVCHCHASRERRPSRVSLLDVGVEALTRILLYCGPRGVVHLGLTNKWCQSVSLRPVLWNFLLNDKEFFVNELPERRKSVAQCFLQSRSSESLPLKASETDWPLTGLAGRDAFRFVMTELTRLCIEQELKEKATPPNWIQKRETHVSCSRVTDMNIFLWSCFLVEVSVILVLLKNQGVGQISWGGALGPFATACILDWAYLFPIGMYSFVLHCFHPQTLLRFEGVRLFAKGLISVPWLLFAVLLLLNIEGYTKLPYSFVLGCLELCLVGIATYCTFRLGNQTAEASRTVLMVYTAVTLMIAELILVGLKVDAYIDKPWVTVWTPIWFAFVAPYCFMAAKRETIIFSLVSLPLVLYVYAPVVMIPFQLDNPKQFGWTVIFYFLLPIFIFYFLGCCAYSCEKQRCA